MTDNLIRDLRELTSAIETGMVVNNIQINLPCPYCLKGVISYSASKGHGICSTCRKQRHLGEIIKRCHDNEVARIKHVERYMMGGRRISYATKANGKWK